MLDDAFQAAIGAFREADLVAFGERHWARADADFRLRLVRDPAFVALAPVIVVEFAGARRQPLLDRLVDGESPVSDEASAIWRETTQRGAWDSPVYEEFLLAVRCLNAGLPCARRLRVLAADGPREGAHEGNARDRFAAAVIEREVLARGRKALVVFGALHLYRTVAGNITDCLPRARWFVTVPLGGPDVSAALASESASPADPALLPLAGHGAGALAANDLFERGTKRVRMADGKPLTVDGRLVLEPAQVFAPGVRARDAADACLYFGPAPPEFVPPPRL